jgi:hypothetical protein
LAASHAAAREEELRHRLAECLSRDGVDREVHTRNHAIDTDARGQAAQLRHAFRTAEIKQRDEDLGEHEGLGRVAHGVGAVTGGGDHGLHLGREGDRSRTAQRVLEANLDRDHERQRRGQELEGEAMALQIQPRDRRDEGSLVVDLRQDLRHALVAQFGPALHQVHLARQDRCAGPLQFEQPCARVVECEAVGADRGVSQVLHQLRLCEGGAHPGVPAWQQGRVVFEFGHRRCGPVIAVGHRPIPAHQQRGRHQRVCKPVGQRAAAA